MEQFKTGTVFLVGAGPGDPGLFTIRGAELLNEADVVIYDHLASPRLLTLVRPDAERIYVGKQAGRHTVGQDGINQLIVDRAKEGKNVVRLKGGDPFIFGRGGEEAQVLRAAGIPFEVVPGVTSAIAVPAYAGIPLTHRSHTASVALITGHRRLDLEEADVDWEGLAKGVGTLVFLMGVKNLSFIAEQLMSYGRRPDTPAAVIRWGTTPFHKTVTGTLSDIAQRVQEAGLKPPALIVVGEVIRLREEITWFENRPLLGKRILVTRTRDQASDLIRLLERRGAHCIECPTIELTWPDDLAPLDGAIESLAAYDWIVFTSANAVRFFFDRLFATGHDIRKLGRSAIAVVGSATAKALEAYHLKADLIPSDFRAEGLIEAFAHMDMKGKRVLLPRAEKAREILPEALTAQGAQVDIVTAYRSILPAIPEEILASIGAEPLDLVTFTSSSTVSNLFKLLPQPLREKIFGAHTAIACIGPITAETARELGLKVSILPEEATIPAMISAIETFDFA